MGRRRFSRKTKVRNYRKRFVIAVEGRKTEPQYFALFPLSCEATLEVKCLKPSPRGDSAPHHVLKRLTKFVNQQGLEGKDEAWLVVDRDEWPSEQLDALYEWTKGRSHRFLALSNPSFEYWLLLHFEDGAALQSKEDCLCRLKRHLPNYDKQIKAQDFSRERIREAVRRAQQRDHPPVLSWPDRIGQSTVYRLVEKLLAP